MAKMLTPSPSLLQNLLPQFQARYPLGSLSSDLLTIHQGHYVVRSTVQVAGVILATGLASASDVEAAEDRSKIRALEGLGLGSPVPTLTATPLMPSETGGQPIPSASPRSDLLDATEFSEFNSQDWLASHLPGRLTADAGASPGRSVDFSKASFSEASSALGEPTPSDLSMELSTAQATAPARMPQEVDTPPLTPVRTVNRFEFSADLPLPDAPVANPVPPLPVPVGDPSEPPQLESPQLAVVQSEKFSEKLSEKASEKPSEKPKRSAAVKAELTEPTHLVATIPTRAADRSEEIAKIGIEVKRLGWSPEQGKEYLKRTYGKRSRQELSDAELLDFLHYLETQPSVMQTPF
jgi:hypothetical protein